jgi:SAM-dependent methyltransferase
MFVYDKKYKFTETWFDPMIPAWTEIFDSRKETKIKSVLEIGSYEGRATVFLCSNVLDPKTKYDIVDTFGGSIEESGMSGTADRLSNNDFIYENFMHNISFHTDIDFDIHRGMSQNILPTLVEANKKYDLIYIDASHEADDTFIDAYYAHKMLNKGGLLIFDDFGWKDPNRPHPLHSPELGIRMFFNMYENDYQLIGQGYQVYAEKIN